MTAQCREGHESTELDYCSVCGAPMGEGGAGQKLGSLGGSSSKGPSASGGADACPSCGEPRTFAEARFCEVCRYDFVTRKGGPPPAVVAAPSQEVSAPSAWELVVSVDPSLDTDPDPATPCPQGEAERVFLVDETEMLVGRRDDRRDIRPEVPLGDPGTSRRHAKFVKNAGDSVSLQDLSSLNGTRLNDADMVPGSRQILKEGDTVTLGRWTRIRLRRRP
jgi:hypothetical protein